MSRVPCVVAICSFLAVAQEDVAKSLAVIQDIKAALPDREAAVKGLGKSKHGGLALLDLVAQNKLPAELKATAAFAVAASPDPDIRIKGEQVLPRPKSRRAFHARLNHFPPWPYYPVYIATAGILLK